MVVVKIMVEVMKMLMIMMKMVMMAVLIMGMVMKIDCRRASKGTHEMTNAASLWCGWYVKGIILHCLAC